MSNFNYEKQKNLKLKTNTNLLLDYLEGTIADEMILNSFIRDISIIEDNNYQIIISTSSMHSKNVIENEYSTYLEQGLENIYSKPCLFKIVLKEEESDHQISQSLHISNKYTINNLMELNFNSEVFKMIKKAIEFPGKMSPLFITSKSGLGKTHTLHAIANEAIKNGKSAIYIEPNKFTNDIVKSIKNNNENINDFTDSFLKFDFLLFDDIQNLGDRSVTLNVLFNILNQAFEHKKQIVICSDKTPNELSGFEDRFITRFVSGLSTTISDPTQQDLIKLLQFKLKRKNIDTKNWEDEAIKFIVRNHSASVRSIEGAVKRIIFFSEDSATEIKYTYRTISNIFKNLEIDPKELTPDRILEKVAEYYKIPKAQIVGKSRKKEYVIARHMAIWLIKKTIDLPYKEIGRVFGNRDHSTIISSINKIEEYMKINQTVKLAANKIEKKFKKIN